MSTHSPRAQLDPAKGKGRSAGGKSKNMAWLCLLFPYRLVGHISGNFSWRDLIKSMDNASLGVCLHPTSTANRLHHLEYPWDENRENRIWEIGSESGSIVKADSLARQFYGID